MYALTYVLQCTTYIIKWSGHTSHAIHKLWLAFIRYDLIWYSCLVLTDVCKIQINLEKGPSLEGNLRSEPLEALEKLSSWGSWESWGSWGSWGSCDSW